MQALSHVAPGPLARDVRGYSEFGVGQGVCPSAFTLTDGSDSRPSSTSPTAGVERSPARPPQQRGGGRQAGDDEQHQREHRGADAFADGPVRRAECLPPGIRRPGTRGPGCQPARETPSSLGSRPPTVESGALIATKAHTRAPDQGAADSPQHARLAPPGRTDREAEGAGGHGAQHQHHRGRRDSAGAHPAPRNSSSGTSAGIGPAAANAHTAPGTYAAGRSPTLTSRFDGPPLPDDLPRRHHRWREDGRERDEPEQPGKVPPAVGGFGSRFPSRAGRARGMTRTTPGASRPRTDSPAPPEVLQLPGREPPNGGRRPARSAATTTVRPRVGIEGGEHRAGIAGPVGLAVGEFGIWRRSPSRRRRIVWRPPAVRDRASRADPERVTSSSTRLSATDIASGECSRHDDRPPADLGESAAVAAIPPPRRGPGPGRVVETITLTRASTSIAIEARRAVG